MAVTAKGTPYVESSDLVANYPGVSLALANHIDTIGKVLQVVSVIKQDTFTTSSTSYVDVTGLTVSITPSKTSSKILVTACLSLSNSGNSFLTRGQILRGSTVVGGGTPAGNRVAGSFTYFQSAADDVPMQSMTVLDSPSSITAVVYKIQVAANGGTTAVGFGFSSDVDQSQVIRNASSITLMEISA